MTMSWLPARHTSARSSTIWVQRAGSAPYPVRSPRHQSSSVPASSIAARTASSAARFAWTSEMTATFTGAIYRSRRGWRRLGLVGAVELREVLDALLGLPLRVVVAHRVDELLHEARREVHPRDDDAGDLLVLDLVVDPREGDRELVVGVADVGEVGVDARHDLRREVDVQVALGSAVFVLVHARTLSRRGRPRSIGLPDVSEVSRVPRRRERAITRTDYQQGRPGNHRPGAASDGWIGDREGGAATEARLLAVEAEDGLAVHRDVQLLLPARPLVVLLDKDLVGVGRDEEVH